MTQKLQHWFEGLSFAIGAIGLALMFNAAASPRASAQSFPIANCRYSPTDSVFRAGQTRFYHTGGHSGAPREPGTTDTYQILLPDVKRPAAEYRGIQLSDRDTFTIEACGCVQTGGTGKTWKRYVDPSGPNSDHLYRGLIALNYDNARPPGGGWTTKNMRTIQDWIASSHGNPIGIIKGHTATLLLGYQDDDYSDNGYWGHDDGTGDQCKGVGGAAVEVVVKHN